MACRVELTVGCCRLLVIASCQVAEAVFLFNLFLTYSAVSCAQMGISNELRAEADTTLQAALH